jgi:phage terminase large subunit GpA-like protein
MTKLADHEWLDGNLGLPQPDRRPIYAWAHDNIPELPSAYAIRGRFDVRNSPWLIAPFDSMSDPLVRRTTVSKAIQSGGTLLAEITAAYRIVNDPGPSTFTCQSAEMATLEGKTRMFPLFESIEAIRHLLPRPGPLRTQTEVFFPGGLFFILNSANLSHQQSQSVRYKINDEIWLPQWAQVYEDACKRVTAFEQQGTSHILDISQGGIAGDWSDWSFANGSMEEWSANCEGCGKSMPLHIRQKMTDDAETYAGLVWDRDAHREDGTIDDVRAAETARFRCPHCGHEHEDSDRTRAAWRRSGHYVAMKENPPKHWKSFHWEALTAHPMHLLAAEFAQAETHFAKYRDETPRQKFRQKREARSWVVHRESINLFETPEGAPDYTTATYRTQRVPGEVLRTMTIDRQQSHFWVEVRAWTAEPASWQLFFGRIDTLDGVRAVQAQYQVPDPCVAQDRRYQPAQVDAECVRFGWRGLMGYPRKTWTLRNESTDQLENYPHSDPKFASVGGGISAAYYEFSTFHAKDIVAAAASGKGIKWHQPSDVNPLYREHLAAEEKKEVRPGVFEWREVKQDNNHGFDTSAMQVIVAIVAGLVRCKLD